ncbi:hypothetical protein SMALA_7085 [Streptomyces malaysiensis subsp. malaysiensis]|nr:hypothetical protein SMALA_7085 [Streptomyces malaysiensis]
MDNEPPTGPRSTPGDRRKPPVVSWYVGDPPNSSHQVDTAASQATWPSDRGRAVRRPAQPPWAVAGRGRTRAHGPYPARTPGDHLRGGAGADSTFRAGRSEVLPLPPARRHLFPLRGRRPSDVYGAQGVPVTSRGLHHARGVQIEEPQACT